MTVPVLAAGDLVRVFDGERTVRALDGVSIEVAAGELVGVTGPSGSGKSTLLHALAALDRPTAGRVRLWGDDPWELDAAGRARLRLTGLGLVFQDPQLVPELTVRQNVALPARAAGADRDAASDRATSILDELGLGDRLEHRPRELSGGEAQRVGVARALVNAPRALLLDEPTAHLDDDAADAVLRHVRDFVASGGAALLTTHDPRTRPAIARSVALRAGRVVTP